MISKTKLGIQNHVWYSSGYGLLYRHFRISNFRPEDVRLMGLLIIVLARKKESKIWREIDGRRALYLRVRILQLRSSCDGAR
jgi:hypothetical protein